MISLCGQGVALPGGAGAEQELAHRGGEAHADGGDVGGRELHRVVDRHAGRDRAAGRVDVEPDVLLGVLPVEVEQLGGDLVGDRVVDLGAEEDDALPQEAVVDVLPGIGERRRRHGLEVRLIHGPEGSAQPCTTPHRRWVDRHSSVPAERLERSLATT